MTKNIDAIIASSLPVTALHAETGTYALVSIEEKWALADACAAAQSAGFTSSEISACLRDEFGVTVTASSVKKYVVAARDAEADRGASVWTTVGKRDRSHGGSGAMSRRAVKARNEEILKALASGETQADVAAAFGLTQGRISQIARKAATS